MATTLRSVTVKLPSTVFKQVKEIAGKRGETVSDTIRDLISRGLDERIYLENSELLSRIVREQMEQVCQKLVRHQTDRAVDPRDRRSVV